MIRLEHVGSPVGVMRIPLLWSHLKENGLGILKNVEASFLRKGDDVSKYTASCIVHIFETLLIGDLRNEVLPSSTRALEKNEA